MNKKVLYLPYNLCKNLNSKLSENKSQKERKGEQNNLVFQDSDRIMYESYP